MSEKLTAAKENPNLPTIAKMRERAKWGDTDNAASLIALADYREELENKLASLETAPMTLLEAADELQAIDEAAPVEGVDMLAVSTHLHSIGEHTYAKAVEALSRENARLKEALHETDLARKGWDRHCIFCGDESDHAPNCLLAAYLSTRTEGGGD